MAALDFPSSPTVGQVYAPNTLAQPSYVWDGTQWKLLALPDQNPTSGLRNVLINGSLSVAQRNFPGAGFVGSAWTYDRWWWECAGSSATMTAPFGPRGDPNVPGDPRYMFNVVVNSLAGANNYACWYCRVENVRQLEGQKATASFSIKGDAGKYFSMEFAQNFGTGGSPSASVLTALGKLGPCNGNWQRFSVTFDVPSIFGKTIGSGNDSYFWLLFWLDGGATYNTRTSNLGQQSGTWSFAQLQLEKGAYPSFPERRPVGYELNLCQRYYETGTEYQIFPSPNGSGYAHTFSCKWKAVKRATPTVSRSFSGLNAVGTSCWTPQPNVWNDDYWVIGNAFTNIIQTSNWNARSD